MRALQDIIEYDVEVKYLPGAKNYVQDALSRRPDYQEPPLPRPTVSRWERETRKKAEMASAGDVAGTEVPGKVSGKASGEVGVRKDTGEAAEEVSGEVAKVNLGFGIAEVTHGELFGLVVLEGEEWLQRVREGYERDTYFREVLTVLKGAPNGPGDE
jgi:hypothetical protein